MPRNGSGTYSLPQPPFVSGTVISSAAMNSDLSDIASALTGSVAADGQTPMTGQLKLPDGALSVPSWTFTTEANTGMFHLGTGEIAVTIQGTQVGIFSSTGWSGSVPGTTPVGMIASFAGATVPAKWYLCYGQAVSRTTYSALFTAIGTTYGSGDGVTTFNLPDCRGRVIPGLDNMGGSAAGVLTTAVYGSDPTVLGDAGGLENHTLALAELPNVPITFTGTPGTATSTNTNIPINCSTPIGVSGPGGTQPITGTIITNLTSSFTPAGSISPSNLNGNTTQTAFPTITPSIVMNTIIYAGA